VGCPCCGGTDSRYARTVAGFRLERCLACRLVFVNPQPVDEDLTGLYLRKTAESQAEFYASTVSPAQIAEYDRIVGDLTAVAPGGRLLDLGCAAGYFMQRAQRAGFETHGIDLATWVEEVAASRGISNVRSVSLEDARFPDEWFDVVHSSQVFEHLPRPLDVLKEVRRILKPGGVLYVNVPNYQCLSIVLGRDDFELNTPPEHVLYFTPATLAELLSRAGFSCLTTSSYGGVKWENLLGRPIRSEIAEAVRAKTAGVTVSPADVAARPVPRPGLMGSAVRRLLYRTLQVGMTLEAVALKPTVR
jgi:2-polyprenyl-3-methyl-5-hydroxy-6-metoxy-1,4-benzoquinol methylase